ncbi:leucine-rich repeat domain-containing protein [Lachnotalea glycerini]|uniref:Leucine-rich repeat domain-containing protein n=2 Tax=Lachnotalea glycerini TaxID=1763509 RepID=A0A371JAW8_9FIRM|nr:leucine-rich repeat domain-containing protein [Lachnotalea glycerini]
MQIEIYNLNERWYSIMKKYLNILLSLSILNLLIIALIWPASTVNAATRFKFVDSNNITWEFTLYGGSATDVRLASSASGTLTVPSTLDGYPVTSVAAVSTSVSFLQSYGKSVTAVIFPDTLEEIKDYALYNVDNITSVTIPNSVTKIGAYALANMDQVTSLSLPNSIKYIGAYAFYSNCFTKLTIPGSVTVLGNYLCYSSKLQSVIFQEGVTAIPANCFQSCTSLTSVSIPNTVTEIPSNCFYKCTALRKISIPDSIKSVQSYAFGNCTYLREVILGSNVATVGNCAFYECDGLGSLYVLNKNVQIYDSANTISTAPLIRCYKGSTMDAYATKYGRVVKYLE